MFLQLVTDRQNPQNTRANVTALFQYHPLLITALVETAWRNRYVDGTYPFDAWPAAMTDRIIKDFYPHGNFPRLQAGSVNWDHLIYAYLVENTRIYDIFRKVMDIYQHSEQLYTRSVESQLFWRNTEYLLYSDPAPTTVWQLNGATRKDEQAHRMTVYWRAFGLDLTHAEEIEETHPYQKPDTASLEFTGTFDAFAHQVWCGIMNSRNTSGPNETDDEAIATTARRLYDMLVTGRLNGNLSREEFRSVAIMSWLHLAVMFDSPVVVDLRAQASSPEQRLFKIAESVGMKAHPKSKALFDLAQPISFLLQAIEQGTFNTPRGARTLYSTPFLRRIAEIVLDQYSIAMERDVKAQPVTVTPQLPPPARLVPVPHPAARQLASSKPTRPASASVQLGQVARTNTIAAYSTSASDSRAH